MVRGKARREERERCKDREVCILNNFSCEGDSCQ